MPAQQSDPPHATLRGQVALVTGASSGIGQAIAIGLARAGADVAVNYWSSQGGAEETIAAIEALGRKAIALRADVASEQAVDEMLERIKGELGELHILVANAGIQDDAPIETMTLAQWNRVLAVNLTGQFVTARAAIGIFRKRGVVPATSRAAGKIICVTSVHQAIPWSGHVNYAVSKSGAEMLMQSLAQEVAPDRIRVNAIAPGAIRTPINRDAWETEAALSRLLTLIPYGRIGEPEDVANAAAWLASDAADYVVGTTLFVDGGMMLYPGFADNG
jgi:glucose 1-dehydrogenase